LLGKVGNLDQADSVIATATNRIRNGEIEPNRITKTVLVVDEAQDMDVNEYGLIEALMAQNEEMRLLLVGDDDQNIYEFRGANSKYMHELIETHNAKKYELFENYRSKANLVAFTNEWVAQLPNRLKEVPIVAVNKSDGKLEIVEHASQRLITAVIENIKRTGLKGSTCVLTKTNKEAVYITGLLVKNGFSARLIQANDGFSLYNLQELRYFTELLNAQQSSPIIGEEEWQEAKRDMIRVFARSHQLEACQVILEDFATINPARKYKSDWKLFLAESRFEDFVQIKGETIYVSTIHKAKGKEFENVFLMLDRFDITKDESKRELYVAVTRAKTNLTIHYNGNYLNDLVATKLNYNIDSNIYSPPDFLSRVLTHRDVNLGYFEFVQDSINGLKSGDILTIIPGEGLATKQVLVVKYSNDFKKLMETYRSNGFELTSAKVNFIVHWLDSKKHSEVKIILPGLNFSRRS
jgi:ATP-dependent DNA helicase RecQ